MGGLGDQFTKAGGERLAKQITAYWKALGYDVKCTVSHMPGQYYDAEDDRHWSRLYCVRSDMQNGLPRDWIGRKA